MAQRTVGFPVNIYIQEGEVALNFSLFYPEDGGDTFLRNVG
jgi:hypothetical protein